MIRFNCPHCRRAYQLPAALAGLPLVCKGCAQRFVPAAQPDAPPAAPPPPPAPKIERSVAPPAPRPVAPVPRAEPPKPEPKPVPPAPSAADTASATANDVLMSKPDSTPDIDFNVGGPTAASLSDANRQKPKGLSSAEFAVPQPAADTDRDAASVPELDLDALARARTEAELNVPPKPPAARARTQPLLELPVPPPPKALPKREPRPAPAPPPEPEPEPAARSGLIPFAADLFALVVLLAGGMLVGELIVKKHTGAVLSSAAENPIESLLWAAVPLLLALVYLLLAGRGLSLGARVRGR